MVDWESGDREWCLSSQEPCEMARNETDSREEQTTQLGETRAPSCLKKLIEKGGEDVAFFFFSFFECVQTVEREKFGKEYG